MFWSSKKPTREEEKEKQIKGLQHAFPSIRRPNNDDDLFEVRFVVEGQYSSLRILVTGEFPTVAPVIQAHGPVNHPWLNAQKVVIGSPKLKNWAKSSHLAEVVEECVQALMSGTNAPVGKPQVDSYGRPISSSAPGTTTVNPPPTQTQPVSSSTVSSTPYQQSSSPSSASMPSATPVYNNPFAPPPSNVLTNNQRSPTSYQPIAVQPQQSTPYSYNSYPGVVSPPTSGPATPLNQSQLQYNQYAAYPSLAPATLPNTNSNSNNSAASGYSTTVSGAGSYSAIPMSGVASGAPAMAAQNRQSPPPPTITNPSPDNSTKSQQISGGSKKALMMKQDSISPIPIPDIPTSFPELEKLTDIQLERLLNDDVSLTAQARNVDSISTVTALKDQLHQVNHERASTNVKMSEEMMSLQRQAAEMQSKLRHATQEYKGLSEVAVRKFGSNLSDVVIELNSKKEVLDNQSEELGRKLVQGDTELSAFMKEFLDIRTKYHNLHDRLSLATRPNIH